MTSENKNTVGNVGDTSSMNLIDFYNIKLNDIFSSFFIKYFIKLTDNFNSIKEYQEFLYNINNDNPSLEKGMTFFEIYIDKKYNLSHDDMNTAIHIYIKESLAKLLDQKLNYKKEKGIIKTLFDKCFKNIAQYLYEHPNDIQNNTEYKNIIKQLIRYDIYNIIPFKYTIAHYNDFNNGGISKIQSGGDGGVNATEPNPFHETDESDEIEYDEDEAEQDNVVDEENNIDEDENNVVEEKNENEQEKNVELISDL
jgi:hypothetical protein